MSLRIEHPTVTVEETGCLGRSAPIGGGVAEDGHEPPVALRRLHDKPLIFAIDPVALQLGAR